jgi:hypothetical protein
VSLSWRRRVRVGFCPDRLIVREGVVPVAGAGEGGSWHGALEALAQVLEGKRKARVTIVLANAFVRYALLPANETLKTEEQWLALARHRLASVHGRAAEDWEVRLSHTGGARVVAALERPLLEALEAKVEACGGALVSVQPYLMAAFNRLRARAPQGAWWLVIEEAGRLTLALFVDGAWAALRTRRMDERWRIVLPEILERESALLGIGAQRSRVTVCAEGAFEPATHETFALESVEYREFATAGA